MTLVIEKSKPLCVIVFFVFEIVDLRGLFTKHDCISVNVLDGVQPQAVTKLCRFPAAVWWRRAVYFISSLREL